MRTKDLTDNVIAASDICDIVLTLNTAQSQYE